MGRGNLSTWTVDPGNMDFEDHIPGGNTRGYIGFQKGINVFRFSAFQSYTFIYYVCFQEGIQVFLFITDHRTL